MLSLKIEEEIFESDSEHVFQQKESLQQARSIFKQFEKENFSIYGDFEDDVWGFSRDELTERTSNLNFEGMLTPKMKTMLKIWCIHQLENKQASTVQRSLKALKQVILFTREFKEDKVEELVDWIEEKIPVSNRRLAVGSLLNFLDFTQVPESEQYFNELTLSVKKLSHVGSVRELPNYNDVLMFQYLLTDLALYWSDTEKRCFYPILLWWKITSVIPMRIGEFCAIKRDCLSVEGDTYYLHIPRKKQKAKRKDHVEVLDKIELNEEMAFLIKEYIDLTARDEKTKTLISYQSYKEYVGDDSSNYASNVFTQQNFRRLIDKFYDEVVNEKYQVNEIERIKPNDTRHFAFCSMMLQGFDVLTIARMGGHRSVESQYHYQQHLDYFTQSHVFHLTKINKLRNTADFRSTGSTMLLESASIKSLQPASAFLHLEPMEYGYCTDERMECESDYCQLCSKWYIPTEELRIHSDKLMDFSRSYKKRIQERLKTMERLRTNMEFDSKENTVSHTEKSGLFREAKNLKGEIEELAKIQSLIGGIDDEDKNGETL